MEYNPHTNTYRARDTGRWVRIPVRRDETGTRYYACHHCGAEDHDKAWVLAHIERRGHDTDPGI